MAEVTARLHHLTGEAAFRSRPQTLLEAFGGQGQDAPPRRPACWPPPTCWRRLRW